MEVIYRAKDGEMFETEEACLRHERLAEYSSCGNHIIGLDAKFRVIPYISNTFLNDTYYLFLADDDAVTKIKERCDEEGYDSFNLEKPGTYFWDANGVTGAESTWQHMGDTREMFKECLAKFNQAAKAIDKFIP